MVLVGVEDRLSEAVARKLVAQAGFDVKQCSFTGKMGAGFLKSNLPSYLSAGNRRPVLLLTDLDDAACAPALVVDWMRGMVECAHFMLRVAVREIEAWLLADRTGIHRFLDIPLRRIAGAPEEIANPKRELLLLAKGDRRNVVGVCCEPKAPRSSAVSNTTTSSATLSQMNGRPRERRKTAPACKRQSEP